MFRASILIITSFLYHNIHSWVLVHKSSPLHTYANSLALVNPTDVPTLQDVDAQKGSNPEPNSRCERDNREPVNEGAHRKLPGALLPSLVDALNVLHGESYPNPVSLPSDPQTTQV